MKTQIQEQTQVLSYEETMERLEGNIRDSHSVLLRTINENKDLTQEQRDILIKLLLIQTQIQLALQTEESGDEENPNRPTYKGTLREVDFVLNNARESLMTALINGDLTSQERVVLSSFALDLLDIAHKMVGVLQE